MSDADLVRQTLRGHTASYGLLVRRWAARIAGFCHARTGSAAAVEELTQETLFRGLQSLPSLSDAEKFGAWLRGIAHRVCLDWVNDRRRAMVPFGELNPDGRSDGFPCPSLPPDRVLEQADELEHLMGVVEGLPAPYREVVMIYYYDDVTYDELAAMLDVSKATVNARLTKARQMLRLRMRQLERP